MKPVKMVWRKKQNHQLPSPMFRIWIKVCSVHNHTEERLRVKNCFITYFPETCQPFISNKLVAVELR